MTSTSVVSDDSYAQTRDEQRRSLIYLQEADACQFAKPQQASLMRMIIRKPLENHAASPLSGASTQKLDMHAC